MDLDVRHAPDPVLSEVCAAADPLDSAVVELADAMVAMMRASPGCVGIAAPQVGVPVSLFVLDVTGARRVDSCAGLREMGVQEQPRKLLAKMTGLTLKAPTGTLGRPASISVQVGLLARSGSLSPWK